MNYDIVSIDIDMIGHQRIKAHHVTRVVITLPVSSSWAQLRYYRSLALYM